MSCSQAYIERVLKALNGVDQVSHRWLFKGLGIYYHDTQFALLINDCLYFRTNPESRPLYQAQAMPVFQPDHAQHPSDYCQLPDNLLEQPAELSYWMRIAIEAANYVAPAPGKKPGHQPERRRYSTS